MALYDPDKIFDALETAAEDWANADHEARLLEGLQKSRLAQITLAKQVTAKTKAQAELESLADPEYQEYVRGMVAAKHKAIRARAKYENYQALSEARRTQESSNRSLTR